MTARHPALSVRAAIVRINTQKGEELWELTRLYVEGVMTEKK